MLSQKSDILIDNFGRVINYLRLSITDRCNLRCLYCYPPHKMKYLDRAKICSYSELLQVAKVASQLGIEKIRLTGGELFLRKEVIEFMDSVCKIENIKQIVLTTNGTLLLPYLKRLKEMGIKRINISLDTLSDDLYYRITGSREFFSVMEAIHKALEENFKVKINMVVLNGINEGEITDFMHYFLKNSVEVRFIEFMPLCGSGWKEEFFFPFERIKEMITKRFEIYPLFSNGVAQEFAVKDGNGLAGKIGIIASVTRTFCSSCSRLRLSVDGELRPCLFSMSRLELLPILRADFSPSDKEKRIKEAFKKAVNIKPLCFSKKYIGNDVNIRSLGG